MRQTLTSYWLGLALLHQGRLDEAVARFEAPVRRQDAVWASGLPWTAAALCAPTSNGAGEVRGRS